MPGWFTSLSSLDYAAPLRPFAPPALSSLGTEARRAPLGIWCCQGPSKCGTSDHMRSPLWPLETRGTDLAWTLAALPHPLAETGKDILVSL